MKALQRTLAPAIAMIFLGQVAMQQADAVPSDAAPRSKTRASQASSCFTFKDAEKSFFYKINRSRQRAGRSKLVLDRQLGRVSRKHTWEMASRNYLHHTSPRTLGWRVTRWYQLGENVGVGRSPTSLHNAFMSSPSHRSNVLYSKFRYVGVGTIYRHGALWVTVTFETTRDPGTRLYMSC